MACASICQEVTTLTCDTAEVIVGFAVGDGADAGLEEEGFVALEAGMGRLLDAAAQHFVVFALIEHQRILFVASHAVTFLVVLLTKLNSSRTHTLNPSIPVSAIIANRSITIQTTLHRMVHLNLDQSLSSEQTFALVEVVV